MARHPHLTRGLAVALALGAPWISTSALAQAPTARAVRLADAVRTTLERAPAIATAREEVALRQGARRQMAGAFDTLFRVSPYYEHSEGYLSPETDGQEWKRRFQLSEAAKALQTVREQLYVNLGDGKGELPPCPGGLTRMMITIEGQLLPMPICVPLETDPSPEDPPLDPAAVAADANKYLPAQGTLDPGRRLAFQTALSQALGLQANRMAEDLRQQGIEYANLAYRLVYEREILIKLALERLGAWPTHEIQKTAALDLSLIKPMRSGMVLQGTVHVEGVEDNYRGKPLDPKFGGKLYYPNAFKSNVSLAFTRPLRRGGGRVSVEAPLRAATRNEEASRRRFEQTVAQSTLDSVQAYIDLIAAQTTLGLLGDQFEAQRRLQEATVTLVSKGDAPRSDVTRMNARVADVATSVASTEGQLSAAKVTLAEKMGLTAPDAVPSLAAGERFADTPVELDLDTLARDGANRRADYQAATVLIDGARILRDAAKADARSRLDLTVQVGMATDYFSPYFRVLKDEFLRDKNEPTDSPVDHFNPTGSWRSFSDNWQPQALVKLTYELPFGNNRQLGRLAQAQAQLSRSELQAGDLGRVIGENIVEQAASVRRARLELDQWREAIRQYEETWKTSERLRVRGEISLIDTLQTEQDLTNARLQYVQAQRDYATAVVRFRFETGTLVDFRNGAPMVTDLSALVAGR